MKIVWKKSIASLHRLTQAVQRANLICTAGDPTWVKIKEIFRKNSWICIKFRTLLPIRFQPIVQWLQSSFWPKKCIRRLSGWFLYHCHSFLVIKNIRMEPFFPSIIFLFDKQAIKNSALTTAWNVSSFFFFSWMI